MVSKLAQIKDPQQWNNNRLFFTLNANVYSIKVSDFNTHQTEYIPVKYLQIQAPFTI